MYAPAPSASRGGRLQQLLTACLQTGQAAFERKQSLTVVSKGLMPTKRKSATQKNGCAYKTGHVGRASLYQLYHLGSFRLFTLFSLVGTKCQLLAFFAASTPFGEFTQSCNLVFGRRSEERRVGIECRT